MSRNIWVISDTHFGHANILTFKKADGSPLRLFDNVDQMDDFMIERWNSVVRPEDKVYHLGDVAMNKQFIWKVGLCNGHKRLVRGNHDDHELKHYLPYFEEIYGSRKLAGMLFTHIPVHPESISAKTLANVHGHVHWQPALHYGPKYYNVSVEVLDNYTPISLEELKLKVKHQLEHPHGV